MHVAGTVDPEADGDFILPKRTYSSFHEMGLDPCCASSGWTP